MSRRLKKAIAMRRGIGYPLEAIREATQSVAGWTAVIGSTALVGLWAGVWIARHEIPGPQITVSAALHAFIGWVFFPQLLIAWVTTGLAWYLPMRFESTILRVTALVANVAAWIVITAWVVRLIDMCKFYNL